MEALSYVKVFAALIFVLSLIGLLALAARKLELLKGRLKDKTACRLEIIESLYLDKDKKLVLIKRDEVEHLILLGKNSSALIERQIDNKRTNKNA